MNNDFEKQIENQLFAELNTGKIKTYSEMQRRKAELMNLNSSKRTKTRITTDIKSLFRILLLGCFFLCVIIIINPIAKLRPPVTQTVYNNFSAKDDPTQTDTFEKVFIIRNGSDIWYITPMAEYKIAAKVKSKHRIFSFQDAVAAISKYDLALAWGDLIDPKYDKYIKYSQSGRQYHVSCSKDCPLSLSYITTHSANTHIIAANKQILKGLKYIKTNDIIYMEGLLVNADMYKENNTYTWETSLVRNDNSYDSGCEILYVKKLQIGNKVYQ
ncbi:MAG TPA: hypothetical protein PK033_06720 [Acetivibrio sp.]|nr:hypothetical protein [Clostridium sp.]HOQ36712.1 hypothetical protein [Acetivibrio sp.]HPT90284.1 hypothetical protein [Acetivibrio sp.]HQA57556.1 hypothetical protein [Acetivibrio sp.]